MAASDRFAKLRWVIIRSAGLLALSSGQALCPADALKPVGPLLDAGNGWWPTVSYSPGSDEYLFVYKRYNSPDGYGDLKGRCVNATTEEFTTAQEFDVGENCSPGIPLYNPHQGHWLVVYSSDHDFGADIYGQKIGSTGKIGDPVVMVAKTKDVTDPDIAYDPVAQRYLLVWTDHEEVEPGVWRKAVVGRLFDEEGVAVGPEIRISGGTAQDQASPVVCYNPATREFMVAWTDQRYLIYRSDPDENNDPYKDIFGQRIDAASGTLTGNEIALVTPYQAGASYVKDGEDTANALVCNTSPSSPLYGSYFLAVQKTLSTKALIFNGDGSDLNHDGSHYDNIFAVSYPDRGAWTGLVYNPGDDTYLASYKDVEKDISVLQFTATGQAIRPSEKIIANPDYEENFGALALRPQDGQCFQVTTWFENLITHETPHKLVAQRFIRDSFSPGPVAEVVVLPGRERIRLTWTNPLDADFTGTRVVYSTTDYPTAPDNGNTLAGVPGEPGATSTFVHAGLSPGVRYYYSLFPHDASDNYGPAVSVSGTPRHAGDLDGDGDVDQADFGLFQACLAGLGVAYGPECEDADLEANGDVGPGDFALFEACIGGANSPPKC